MSKQNITITTAFPSSLTKAQGKPQAATTNSNSSSQADLQNLAKILENMIAVLVQTEFHVLSNQQKMMQMDADISHVMVQLNKNLVTEAKAKMESMIKQLDKVNKDQEIEKWFGIAAGVIGCAIGFLVGGVGGLVVGAALFGLMESGVFSKVQTDLAKMISGSDHPPEWAQAVAGIIITAVVVVASAGVGAGINGALSSIFSSSTTSAANSTANVVEDEVADEVVEDAIEDATQTNNSSSDEPVTPKAQAIASAKMLAQMSAIQMLGATNVIGNLAKAVLKKCKVSDTTASIISSIISAVTLIVAALATANSGGTEASTLLQRLLGPNTLSMTVKTAALIYFMSSTADGISQIVTGKNYLNLSKKQKDLSLAQGMINQGAEFDTSSLSTATSNNIQKTGETFNIILSPQGLHGLVIYNEAAAQALLA